MGWSWNIRINVQGEDIDGFEVGVDAKAVQELGEEFWIGLEVRVMLQCGHILV